MMLSQENRIKIIAAAIIVIVIAVAFGGAINAGFHWDDAHAITGNPSIKSISAAFKSFVDPRSFSAYRFRMIRPLTIIAYSINYKIGEFNPPGWHLLNMLFHFCAAIFLAGIASKLLSRLNIEGRPNALGSIAAALFFAAHPVQSEALNYFSARSALMAGAFCIAALYFHLRWYETKRTAFRLSAIACFIAGLASRENAAVFPAMVLAVDLLAFSESEKNIKKIILKTWPYWLALMLYMVYRWVTLDVLVGKNFVRGPVAQLGISIWEIGLYHKLIIMPRGLTIHHVAPESFQVSSLFWIGAISLFVEIILAVENMGRKPIIPIAVSLFYLGILPTLVIPLNIHAAEHRLYLAMAGPAILIAWLVSRLAEKNAKAATAIISIFTVALCVLSFRDAHRWKSDIDLWKTAIDFNSRDELAWNQYGKALKDANRIPEAISAYSNSIEINPTGSAYNNLSIACELAGDMKCSNSAIEIALELEADNPFTHINYGIGLVQQGKDDEAEKHFRIAIELQPIFPQAHRNLAALLMKKQPQPVQEIIMHLEASLDQDPYQAGADELRNALDILRSGTDKK